MKNLIIFSQAPADIIYVLSLYKRFQHSHKIKIIVVNVENNFKYFRNLNLNAQLEFIPLIPRKKIFKFLGFIAQLRLKYKQIFSHLTEADIYYFSNSYDYVTAFFVEKLAVNNHVFFADLYKITEPNIAGAKTKIKQFIFKFLLGVRFKFYLHSGHVAYQYLKPDSIVEMNPSDIKNTQIDLKEFKFRVNLVPQKVNVLFLESNGSTDELFTNYDQQILQIFERLAPHCIINVKPHPRIGYSRILDQYTPTIIDAYIPAEMIELDDFSTIIGIDSAAVATMKHANKLCIVNLFDYVSTEIADKKKAYLDHLDGDKFTYVDNLDDLLKRIKL